MREVFLDISAVTAGYGRKTVISDISLQVHRGETVGLIGLNGAGKTTLLKTILGLKNQTEGFITLEGHSAGTAAAKSRLAYLPERFDPPWFLNAYEFIEFTMSLYKGRIARSDIEAMAVRLGLDVSYLSRRAQSYSKGMRQKLGLLATFLAPVPLLVLDEPMSGLDPLARAQVKDLLIGARREGRTCFLSSHILSDMEELCDRVAVLHNGQLMFTGHPQDLLTQTGQKTLESAFLCHIGGDTASAA